MLSGSLRIEDLRRELKVGCSEAERSRPQTCSFSLRIVWAAGLPKAAETDCLEDTVCYGRLCETIERCAHHKEFQTLEHLGHSVMQALLHDYEKLKSWGVELSVKKIQPPVDGLVGGSIFSLEYVP